MNKILVISVHPDDETLGCGGTLLKHKKNGDEIYWLICTRMNQNNIYYKTRQQEIKAVENAYKFDGVYNLCLETARVDEYPMTQLIEKISAIICEIKPNIVYLPFLGDVHSDHRKIFEASFSCLKTFRYSFVKKIYMMEIVSETEFAPALTHSSFIPNVFSNIDQFFEKKCEILRIYSSEIKDFPFPRSIENVEALAKFRGSMCSAKFAESFMLLKEIL
ncbi:LmbE-like protein [Campylobacter sputorum subsp. bubulus]|uniref:LmbE-like protein n=1 Tax=Campylobacter sputorum subsp. sputorum TaxID=32024 RepID=A0A381DJ46_9BACT|nr:PIG-L family deacetylase [Campylobacter sputorum]ASM35749.1 deacetylase, PIG-L family [Campylobacter sputorum aubsp. sputorum RM3237]KAB0581454.1 PIG-L family deacetylase [Campylobacter sputorum subsp. sputorum]QEL05939.1 deacetylase, PIG-L family [Campylobacter sputorum subsp. sputorum]SUX09034.1 LmbE-like protein [Campylobacter sputorum subsp. bubulus]SUX10724.1 LmbE-like protein [Campylobacter sputorum subsp. sputorum]